MSNETFCTTTPFLPQEWNCVVVARWHECHTKLCCQVCLVECDVWQAITRKEWKMHFTLHKQPHVKGSCGMWHSVWPSWCLWAIPSAFETATPPQFPLIFATANVVTSCHTERMLQVYKHLVLAHNTGINWHTHCLATDNEVKHLVRITAVGEHKSQVMQRKNALNYPHGHNLKLLCNYLTEQATTREQQFLASMTIPLTKQVGWK